MTAEPHPRRSLRCPRCGSTDTARIVYGYPGPEMLAAAERGEIVLGGCSITGDDPTRQCRACDHEFGTRKRKVEDGG